MINIRRHIFLVAGLLLASFVNAASPDHVDFVCPESLENDAARQKSLTEFLQQMLEQNKDLTLEQLIVRRVDLLTKNKCRVTLENIKSETSGTVLKINTSRFQCLKTNEGIFFSNISAKNCKPLPLEKGWQQFTLTKDYVVDLLLEQAVRETDGSMKIWHKFYLAAPISSEGGKWSYNYLKGVSKFYCKNKQTVLIQGTYILNGDIVNERNAKAALLEEIEPGTLNEGIWRLVCGKDSSLR